MTKRKRRAPDEVQFKAVKFDPAKVADEPDDEGFVTFKAYGAVFDNVDSHNDVIRKGAFAKSLDAWAEKGAPIPVYYNHSAFSGDPLDNMGFLSVAEEDGKGLAVEVSLDVKHNPKAAYAHRLIKSDRLRELSIGYIARKFQYEPEEGQNEWDAKRALLEVDLLEVSVVSVASNPQATVTEKAATFRYGAQQAAKDDDGDVDETPAGKAVDGDTADAIRELTEGLKVAIDGVFAEFEAAVEKLLDGDEDDDEDGEDPPADEDNPDSDSGNGDGNSAGAKKVQLSARSRVALSTIALHGAEGE